MSSAPTHKSALSLSFGREADRYDQARPSYPRAVAEAISRHADALIGRALEVGAGTGKGTEILVAAGVKEIVALEPDPDMAARLEGTIDGVTVRVEPFEAYTTDRPYDVLLSTQAWHWLDPRMRLAKAASCVRAGGVLALVWNVYGIADHDVHKETSAWAERWKVELKLPLLDESTRIMVPWPETLLNRRHQPRVRDRLKTVGDV